MVTPARYVPRVNTNDAHWWVFDSFTQEFCVGERYETYADAIKASARINAAYSRATAP